MVLLLAKQIITLYHAVQKILTKDQQALVQAKSDSNNISLIFTKNKFVDMDSLVEQVAIEFCDEDETRYLL